MEDFFHWDGEGFIHDGEVLKFEDVDDSNSDMPPMDSDTKSSAVQREVIEIDASDTDEDDVTIPTASPAERHAATLSEYDESKIHQALARFGHTALRGLQEPALKGVFGGYDTVVLLPTGGGKSLCYQLPALLLPGLVLVISPLLALIQDQVHALKKRGIRVEMLCSIVSYRDKQRVHGQLLRDANVPDHPERIELLYTTPETLRTEAIQTILKIMYENRALSLVAIDEAHCISTWGHDFRPAYLQLRTVRERFPLVPIMALTATATERVRADIQMELLLRPDAKVLTGNFNRLNISYTSIEKYSHGDPVHALYSFIKRCHYHSVGIVYVHRRLDTQALVLELQKKDASLQVAPYHAEIPTKQREQTLLDWLSGKVNIICATIAFGMGIDHPAVRFVVHWNMPKSLENLYQEAGRAGRDGHPSHHVLMFNRDEYERFRDFLMMAEQELREKEQRGQVANRDHVAGLREKLKKLERVMAWATTTHCRRQQVLAYFGQSITAAQCNGTCDACASAYRFSELQPLVSHRPTRMMVHAQVQSLLGTAAVPDPAPVESDSQVVAIVVRRGLSRESRLPGGSLVHAQCSFQYRTWSMVLVSSMLRRCCAPWPCV